MIELTLEKAVELAREAVAERGEDWVYPREWKIDTDDTPDNAACQYFLAGTDQPACIVGMILSKLGLHASEMNAHEGQSAWALFDHQSWEKLADVDASYEAGKFLSTLQRIQDAGGTWGYALEQALA